MPKEYVISGHSGETEDTFRIPYNLTLLFFADPHETCYVPTGEDNLRLAIGTMRSFQRYNENDIVNDYDIVFDPDLFEGVSEITDNSFSFFINAQTNPYPTKLSELCTLIQRRAQRIKTTIFCVFCRGSRREYADKDFGDFDLINEDDLDFDLGLAGGKKTQKPRKRKHAKSLRKHKRSKKRRHTRKHRRR